jgi:hypothetical protein
VGIRIEMNKKEGTDGVPLILRTFNCVSSKLIYPRVKPANTPERITRTGMRQAKTMNFTSCFWRVSSARFICPFIPRTKLGDIVVLRGGVG